MLKICKNCKVGFKTYDSRRKFCNFSCYSKSGIPTRNLGTFTKSEVIGQRNKRPEFRKSVSNGLIKYFSKNPRYKEKWFIKKYGENYRYHKAAYGEGWMRISKEIKKQHPFCSLCGKKDVVLDVHHIIPFRISKSHSVKNLVVYCKKCHRTVEENNKAIFGIINDWDIVSLLLKYFKED